ncbi:MAG: hypothetical protein AB7E70_02940 [Hyphomicrobiaceae bacterium]
MMELDDEGNADIAAAKAFMPDIAGQYARYGVKPPDVAAKPVVTAKPTAPAASHCAQAESHWKSAEEIKTIEVYEDHLRRFAGCRLATLARARIKALKKPPHQGQPIH